MKFSNLSAPSYSARKHSLIASVIIFGVLAMINGCSPSQPTKTADKTATPTQAGSIRPVPFPSNLGIPGFTFPEDQATILGWLNNNPPQMDQVNKHAWGIWAGLTSPSGQSYYGQQLLVYETWLGITDLQTAVQAGNKDGGCNLLKSARTPLTRPHQLEHASRARLLKASATTAASPTPTPDATQEMWVSVAYDPNAACFATKNLIFQQSVLQGYVKPNAIGAIPVFPNTAITIKPVYFVGHQTDSLIQIAVWPGPPSPPGALSAYPQPQPSPSPPIPGFNLYVYADVNNQQPAGKKPVPARGPTPTQAQIAAATCNLADFINFKIDAAAAAYINQQQSGQGVQAQAGDLALLVAMHVATKEDPNWTWQTFFWAPDADNPLPPSSQAIASLRPSQLYGPAAHYALTTAYAMVMPNQPVTGGTNQNVQAVIGYNPYLEASFEASTFQGFPNALKNQWGIQTNCMSCHAMAVYDPAFTPANQPTTYSADQYIDMQNPFFKGKVQLDFAWSISAAINPTATPAPK